MNYTNAKMLTMHYVYGLAHADGNTTNKSQKYVWGKYPNAILFDYSSPSLWNWKVLRKIDFEQSEHLKLRKWCCRNQRVRGRSLQLFVIKLFEFWLIFLLYPYRHYFPWIPQCDFYQWYFQNVTLNPQIESQIMFTDEANFSRNTTQNFHNNHVWADENPHAITETHFQDQLSVNLWVGIIGNKFIGLFFCQDAWIFY